MVETFGGRDFVVGDRLVVERRSYGNVPLIVTVTKVTPTMYVCGSVRIYKSNLRAVGSRMPARACTSDDITRQRIATATWELSKMKVTESNLKAVELLIEKHRAAERINRGEQHGKS